MPRDKIVYCDAMLWHGYCQDHPNHKLNFTEIASSISEDCIGAEEKPQEMEDESEIEISPLIIQMSGAERRDGVRRRTFRCCGKELMTGGDGMSQFKCTVCGKKFIHERSLAKNVDTCTRAATQVDYVCTSCGEVFVQRRSRLRHEIYLCKNRPHPCLVCGLAFSGQSGLKTHLRKHRRDPVH